MHRLNLALALLITFLSSCSSDVENQPSSDPSQKSDIHNQSAEWRLYSPKDKDFQVDFPGLPELWETEFESPEHGHTEVHHASVQSNGIQFGVNYNDYPRDLTTSEVQAELKYTYSLPGTGAKILATAEVEVAGVPAIEVITKTGPIYIVGRFFIYDARRMYSLQVGGMHDPRDERKTFDRFFDSFQISKSAATKSTDQP